MDEFCKEKGFIGWYETSAKENINIDESARFLVTKVGSMGLFLKKMELHLCYVMGHFVF